MKFQREGGSRGIFGALKMVFDLLCGAFFTLMGVGMLGSAWQVLAGPNARALAALTADARANLCTSLAIGVVFLLGGVGLLLKIMGLGPKG